MDFPRLWYLQVLLRPARGGRYPRSGDVLAIRILRLHCDPAGDGPAAGQAAGRHPNCSASRSGELIGHVFLVGSVITMRSQRNDEIPVRLVRGRVMNQDMAAGRHPNRSAPRQAPACQRAAPGTPRSGMRWGRSLWVESPLKDRAASAPARQRGAPPAWLAVEPDVAEGIRDLRAGEQIIVLTWLDRGRRHERPGRQPRQPAAGVFSTRSPDRPNPIAQILIVEGLRILVSELEALDRTPVIDIKPVLDPVAER